MALSPRDRRILMIGGGVVAAALALFLIVNLLGGGSDTTTALPPVSVGPAPAPSVSPSPSPSVVQDFSGRDPFSPPAGLATAVASTSGAPAGGGGGGGGGGGTIPGTTTFTSTPPIPPPTTTTSSPPPTHTPPPPPSCKGEKPTVCKEVRSHVVLLERVFKRHHKPEADVKVDRKIYKSLKEGDRFAHHFKLVGFNEQNCPRIIFGEEGFTLCESGKHHHH
jgi:hypothetical protein